jgi:hypothetical protein
LALLDDIEHIQSSDADKAGYAAEHIDPNSLTQEHLDAYTAHGGSADEAINILNGVTVCCCCCP